MHGILSMDAAPKRTVWVGLQFSVVFFDPNQTVKILCQWPLKL